MSYAKLIINGVEAEAFSVQDIPINLKKRITNLEGDPAASFTRSSIKIPATKVNKSILDGNFDFLPFRVEINGATRLSGFLKVTGAELSNNCYNCVIAQYKAALYGGNSDWFVPLRSCRLDELTEESFIFDGPTIQSGFNADPDAVNFGFIYIKFKEWENNRIVQETDNIGGGTVNRTLESPSYFEATPFLFIRPLIIEAFRKVGYTIQSNFLNSEFFKRLIFPVPLPDKLNELYNEYYLCLSVSKDILNIPITNLIVNNVPFDSVDKLPSKNPGVWDGLLLEYTAPEDGFYEVEIGLTFGPEAGTFAWFYLMAAYINGFPVTKANGGAVIEAGSLVPGDTQPFLTNTRLTDSSVFQLNKGDIIQIKRFYYSPTQTYTVLNSTLNINGEALKAEGIFIDFQIFLNKYEFLPLLRDLSKMFNLNFDTNFNSKRVLIEPADPYFYSEKTPAILQETREGYYFLNQNNDLSKKVDYTRAKDIKINEVEGFFKYNYKADDEETINYVEENERFKIYEAIFNTPNGADKNKTKNIETEFFVKTIHARDEFARYPDTNVRPLFPLIYPKNYILDPTATADEAEYDVGPRILYFAGQRAGADGFIEINENQGTAEPLPAAFMVNYNDTIGKDPSLAWSKEIINGLSVPGLVENYIKHSLSRISKREQLKAFICFNNLERDNFTFRNRIIIDGKKYIVLEVESVNPLNNTPDKFLFMLDEFAGAEIVNLIDNTNLKGVVSIFP